MVVDGGRAFGEFDLGRLVVAPYLWDQGIRHIHYLVASHPQLDHIGGLIFLMERFSIGEVWTNGVEREGEFYQQFKATLKQKGLTERKISREDAPQSIGPCLVHFLNPAPVSSLADPLKLSRTSLPVRQAGPSQNNRSIVLKLSCYSYSVILTGDIEQTAEQDLSRLGSLLEATVIKVPHHGSRGSIETAFLEAVSPKVAVISVGAHNPYGHPAPEVLQVYQRLGSRIFRTDHQGAILIEAREGLLRVRKFRDLVLKPVEWDTEMLFSEWGNIRRLLHPPFSLVLDKG
jgi:competence protein ComEC